VVQTVEEVLLERGAPWRALRTYRDPADVIFGTVASIGRAVEAAPRSALRRTTRARRSWRVSAPNAWQRLHGPRELGAWRDRGGPS